MGLLDLRWGNPKFTTMVNNGNATNRLDVAIMGDGYTTRQRDTFRADANRIVDAFRTTEPMHSYFSHLNFHRVEVFSPQSGTDDMHTGTTRTTALDTFYSPISTYRKKKNLFRPAPRLHAFARPRHAAQDGGG